MTSLKGPSSEHGDTSPELDVLTGPPAAPAVAAQVASEEPAPEPRPETAPIVDTAAADPLPPAEPPIEADEPVSAPVEVAEIVDEIAAAPVIAEEPPAETPQPAAAADDYPPDSDALPPPLAVEPATPEPVEPTVVDARIDTTASAADLVPTPAADAASAPEPDLARLAPGPIAPPPLPETPNPPLAAKILAPHVAAALASASVPPAAVALDAPTQPAPAPILSPPPTTTTTQPARPRWRVWLRRASLSFVGIVIVYAALVLVLIGVYRTVDPPRSTVMLGVNLTGVSVDYEPVPLGSISTYLLRAVVTSEDARFCRHAGVDWGALAEAMQDSRGGSTITMQVAKNLFLWPSRSYIRKAIEIPVALLIDFAWPKRRILEVYLNIAEWGPGIFGAEAAAQYHFGKSASRLTQHEATLLAASLPNPIAREAGDPGRITALLAARLRARMANSDAYVGCLGLRPMPRAEPEPKQRLTPASAAQSPPKSAPKTQPWQTKTEPAKPPTPFNPWQN